eukprot:Gb_16802 [translate_table: standard]
MDKYEKLDKVGQGAYGKVYKAVEKATGQLVALKKTRIDHDGIPCTTLREISLLRNLSMSPYIIGLLNVEFAINKKGKRVLYMIFELMDYNLFQHMWDVCGNNSASQRQDMDPKDIQKLMYQLCKGIMECHCRGVIHRDLKPQNILVNKADCKLKIADFGLGKEFRIYSRPYTAEVCTLWYKPPELLLGETKYTLALDMWSVGCIFAQLARAGQALFKGESEFTQILNIFKVLGTPTEDIWPGLTSFPNWHAYPNFKPEKIEDNVVLNSKGKMFEYDPKKRISIVDALRHPYFDDLDKSQFP